MYVTDETEPQQRNLQVALQADIHLAQDVRSASAVTQVTV